MRKLIFSIAMFVPLLAISQPMQVSRAEAEQAAVKAVCLTYNDYSTRHLREKADSLTVSPVPPRGGWPKAGGCLGD